MMVFALQNRAVAASTTLVAEDTFSYVNGTSLVGNNGGSGWSGAWVSDSPSFTDFFVDGSSLSVPGVTSTGGKMIFVSNTLLNDAARTLPLQNSGVVFIRFLSQFDTQSGGGTPTIRLVASGSLSGGVGNNGGCGSAVYAILDTSLQPITASCSSVSLATLSAVILRIDYTANTTRLWVLPSMAGFDYTNPPAPSAEYAGLAPAFDRISIYSRATASIDELQVLRLVPDQAQPQPVPSMSWLALVALTVAMGLAWLRAGLRERRA